MPSLRQTFSIVLSVAIGVALAALLAEGLVQLFFDEPIQPRFFIDSGYGVRAVEPNVSTRHYSPGEYDVGITTNSAGMRGSREYAKARTPGTRRALVLGDSFAFGFGVEDNEVVSAVLERTLSGQGQPWEVLNLAVSGFGQAEELVTYNERGRTYRPDVVVLFYFDNDIGNNAVSELYSLDAGQGLRRTGNAYLPGVKASELLYAIPPIRWLFVHSAAWNLVRTRLSTIVQNSLLRKQGLQRFDDVKPEAVALTRALLVELNAAVAHGGARLVIFVIPNGGMTSTFPMTADEVRALGADYVDGREFLDKSDYYARDSHWRASGHRKAAERLVSLLKPR